MPSITVKNIPDRLYKKLKKRALENRRSINNEIINSLEVSLGPQKVDVGQLLADAAGMRKNLEFAVSEKEITYAKNRGRL
jgi:plasmid stability protein